MVLTGCIDKLPMLPEKGVSFELNQQRKQAVKNIHYNIELDIPAEKSEAIRGNVVISFELMTIADPLVLDFNTDASSILSVLAEGKKMDYVFADEHIIIDAGALKMGKNSLEIGFVAGDRSLNRSEDFLYTLFVPDRASTCFPLFDQPNLKATFSLVLKTPAGWEAVSNGSLQEKRSVGGKNLYFFSKTKPISSYLFAFAAGKFFKATKSVDGREMNMYYRETDTSKVNKNRDEIFSLHAKSLKWLESYTSIPYPFGKFDFVLLPAFQYGGMEHPGSIFYNEPALFLDENASVNKRMARASVIAHESAHMWFGDLVTMDWFNDVWLKEVFANFMAAKIVHPSFPEVNHNLRFLLAHYPAAYEVDRSSGTNPILQDLGNLKNAGTMYGAIIYQKAPIVMRQLERKIGAKQMQESLRDYLKKHAFGNARWDDLIAIIDKRSPLDIAGWSQVWVKTPNMPEYQITRSDAIQVQQKKDSVSGRIWQQALEVMWVDHDHYENDTIQLTDAQAKRVRARSPQYVFPNADGTAYGYFNMDIASINYLIRNYNRQGDSVATNPVFRGAMAVNQWEGFVRGDGPAPLAYLTNILKILPLEPNPLVIDYLLGNLQSIWWAFITAKDRLHAQHTLESLLWGLVEKATDKGIKTSYFKAFRGIALSKDGLNKLQSLWDGTLVVKDLVLSEEDRISLAYELALKGTDGKAVLMKQLNETKNADRKARMQFVIPALSEQELNRDAFFETLKKEENREKEAWVLDALTYLHHPLRQKTALKYLRPSLEMLQEIQLTGDIFFPTRWTHHTFAGHSSQEAAVIVRDFLKNNPDYPFFLRNKILQATDMLDRAVKLRK